MKGTSRIRVHKLEVRIPIRKMFLVDPNKPDKNKNLKGLSPKIAQTQDIHSNAVRF